MTGITELEADASVVGAVARGGGVPGAVARGGVLGKKASGGVFGTMATCDVLDEHACEELAPVASGGVLGVGPPKIAAVRSAAVSSWRIRLGGGEFISPAATVESALLTRSCACKVPKWLRVQGMRCMPCLTNRRRSRPRYVGLLRHQPPWKTTSQ